MGTSDNRKNQFTFDSQLRIRSSGKHTGSWYFVLVPKEIATQLDMAKKTLPKRGRGSIRVHVQIGFVKWKTSIFPDKKSGTYLLPVKKEVRKQLHLEEGSAVSVILQVDD